MKCLIVEDVEFVREMMVLYLSGHAEVDTAADGVEALALFSKAIEEKAPYQLVCLDILMPRMNGQQALKQMRQLEKGAFDLKNKAIIIMTTASTETTDMEEALWEGDGTDYLVKPVNPDDLLAVLKKYNLVKP